MAQHSVFGDAAKFYLVVSLGSTHGSTHTVSFLRSYASERARIAAQLS